MLLQVDPRAAVAGNNLAYLLAERGDNLEYALVLAQHASETVPNDPVVLDTLGWVRYKKNQPADAVAAFTKAARLAPQKAMYQFHLGLALAQSKDTGKARAALEQALRLEPLFEGAAEARQALASLGGDREN